jgi:hypothetical protein
LPTAWVSGNLSSVSTTEIVEEFGDFDDGLSPEQIEEAERRAERLSRNPERGIPWEQVCAELPERLNNRKCAAM